VVTGLDFAAWSEGGQESIVLVLFNFVLSQATACCGGFGLLCLRKLTFFHAHGLKRKLTAI
jgi:hypothetical protein